MKFQWHSDSSMKALLWLNLTFECQLGMISCILDRSRPPRSSNNIRCNQCFLIEWMDIWIKISCWQTIQNVDDLCLKTAQFLLSITGVERLIRTLCNPTCQSLVDRRVAGIFLCTFAFIHSWLATRKNNIKYTPEARGVISGRMGQRSLCGVWC